MKKQYILLKITGNKDDITFRHYIPLKFGELVNAMFEANKVVKGLNNQIPHHRINYDLTDISVISKSEYNTLIKYL